MRTIVFVILVALILPTKAAAVEEIIVTGEYVNDYEQTPFITVTRPADFLVQSIRLINDSRSPELRKSEIRDTIGKLIQSARKAGNIELSYGEGFLSPVDLNDESLEIIEASKRVDTSQVDIYVKVSLSEGKSAKSQIADLRAFIGKAALSGRTEIESLGDIGLSIVNPQGYRNQILKKIAQENRSMMELMGGKCQISVRGLEGRVEWERTSVEALTLFIPYTTEIRCGDA